MRPWRQVLALTCLSFAVLSLLYSWNAPDPNRWQDAERQRDSARSLASYFRFRGPTSFFPSNAIISLTHENSTTFLARPAGFGPMLPSKGMTGQLWVGSGFGEDALSHRGAAATTEGELGCSDVPGLESTTASLHTKRSITSAPHAHDLSRRSRLDEEDVYYVEADFFTDDGTDNHNSLAAGKTAEYSSHKEHADIQSIQESAEITGKVVLLSRGGCGFYEKVKWAQRRGAVAVIVGDNVRGGSLVQMRAPGDASDITIPSLFTSRTTAHLLSSLMPPTLGVVRQSLSSKPIEGASDSAVKANIYNKAEADQRTFTQSATSMKQAPTSIPASSSSVTSAALADSKGAQDRSTWGNVFWSVITLGFGGSKVPSGAGESRRPPSSGSIDWYMVEDWDNDDPAVPAQKLTQTTADKSRDNFVIGVQDWRDPDVVYSGSNAGKVYDDHASVPDANNQHHHESRSPSSGEYHESRSVTRSSSNSEYGLADWGSEASSHSSSAGSVEGSIKSSQDKTHWLGWSSTSSTSDAGDASHVKNVPVNAGWTTAGSKEFHDDTDTNTSSQAADDHEGLWVTLTPSSISTSPFLDTLIILVISPLVTLTIVYAMLLLRSRIRRRRWRAPKSVVDQLPVRTYYSCATRASSPGPALSATSPVLTPNSCTSTTPLLAGSRAGAGDGRSRPRSRTMGETVPAGVNVSTNGASAASYGAVDGSSGASEEQEKLDAGLAEWRKRYGGKQVECVVCLEEYIDGVSRVMSLPCGHEFHADCITPWLTTRRRTCPICKGDVVRSMAQYALSALRSRSPFDSSDDEDVQAQVAQTTIDSPSAALPITSHSGQHEVDDVEQGEQQTHASQSLPTLRLPRNLRNGLQTLRQGRLGRPSARRPPEPEGRDR